MGVQDSSAGHGASGGPIWDAFSKGSRDWLPAVLAGLVGAAILWPFDGPISHAARGLTLAGDVRRELDALGQYGQGAVSVIAAILIALLDPARRRRLIDWGVAALLVGISCVAMKMLIGRPRPLLEDPGILLGPWGVHPVPVGETGKFVLAHAWELTGRVQYMLGSMPSRHATFAASLSVVLWTLYPRFAPVGWVMMVLVAAMRVVNGAHYPSDVVAGMALGAAVTSVAMRRFWGTRGLDWVWGRAVDKNSKPALAAVIAIERERLNAK